MVKKGLVYVFVALLSGSCGYIYYYGAPRYVTKNMSQCYQGDSILPTNNVVRTDGYYVNTYPAYEYIDTIYQPVNHKYVYEKKCIEQSYNVLIFYPEGVVVLFVASDTCSQHDLEATLKWITVTMNTKDSTLLKESDIFYHDYNPATYLDNFYPSYFPYTKRMSYVDEFFQTYIDTKAPLLAICWGLYESVNDTTIETELIRRPHVRSTSAYWYLENHKYSAHRSDTLLSNPNNSFYGNAPINFVPDKDKQQAMQFVFVPFDSIPPPNTWIRNDKRMWCDKKAYRKWKKGSP